jgi:23S rRNA pseudouridine2604 synthase
MSEEIRLNKYLSTHGYCSRREADRLIEQGRVFVNDRTATLGTKVTLSDDVRVEGRDRKKPPKKIYLLLNKPVGYITTTDRRKPDNVMDLVDVEDRVYPVGRLDVQSSGLLLFTNDGVLTNRLMHPRYEHEKEYVVVVDKPLDKLAIGTMQSGVELDDGKTLPTKVRKMGDNKFAIILREGRNRQIRRMCQALGYEVLSLRRTRIGTLKIIGSYPEGLWRYLTEKEIRDLKKMVGMDPGKAKGPRKRKRKQ